jgi:hypothetical protein
MRAKGFTVSFLLWVAFALSGIAEAQRVTTSSGGSIRTDLGHGIVLNKESSMKRVWITVHDDKLPVTIQGTIGVKSIYAKGSEVPTAKWSELR